MDIQDNSGRIQHFYADFASDQYKESRRFPRYKIKRRILIKDHQGHILTGHAVDISRFGLQFRCSPQVAYQLKQTKDDRLEAHKTSLEVKIALPYMSTLEECGIHCSVNEIIKADEENMRVGLSFLYFDEDSQSRIDHFIDNLTL